MEKRYDILILGTFACAACFLLSACAGPAAEQSSVQPPYDGQTQDADVFIDMPNLRQYGGYTCGTTCVQMVMNWLDPYQADWNLAAYEDRRVSITINVFSQRIFSLGCQFADTGYLGCFDCYTFRSTGVNRVDLVDCWVSVGCRYSDVSLTVFNMYRVSETGNYIG